MDKLGYIEIKINGWKGNLELASDNYDVRELVFILENATNYFRYKNCSVTLVVIKFILKVKPELGHIFYDND